MLFRSNALVEGKGRPVAAVIIGFDSDVVERAGLSEALGNDPAIFLHGGHDPHGSAAAPLDLARLADEVRAIDSRVEAYAVTAQFSVRNPEHELAAAEVVRELTGKPVTLSHHLSARLNGPKRAVTAILNARLIPIIDGLVRTTEVALEQRGVRAPLMVVRGDGSLVSAAFVRERPIETILSGPAASLVGAAHLTGLEDAIISDELNHASIIDGIRLSKARRLRYDNNDMRDLERRLKESQDARYRLVATDGVFSMDGVDRKSTRLNSSH